MSKEDLSNLENNNNSTELNQLDNSDSSSNSVEPDNSDIPSAFDEPDNSDSSSAFDEPDNSDNSSAFDEPDNSDNSSAFDEPDNSDSSSSFDEPDNSDNSSAFDEPDNSDSSSAFDEPDNSDSSSASDKSVLETLENVAQTAKEQINLDEDILDKNAKTSKKQEKKKTLNFLKMKKQKNKSNIILYTIIGILIALIFLTIIVFFVVISTLKNKNIEIEENSLQIDFNELDYSQDSFSAEFILLNKQQDLDGQTVTLSKILIDEKYTYAYFKDFIDVLKFDIYIIDENNNLYSRDLSFNTSIDDYENVLRFEKINEDANILKLYFINNTNGKQVFYSILITDDIKVNSVKYLNNPIETKFNDFNITITNALFSPISSRIDYIVENNSSQSYTIQSGLDSENTNIYLLENNLKLKNLRKTPLVYKFSSDNIEFNRMDFSGVSSLKSTVLFCLSDLYKRYDLNTKVSYDEIAQDREKVIPFDNYNLVVERLGKFDDTIVLVLHGENTEIDNSQNEEINRIEVIPDAEVVIKASTGMEITIKGNVKSSTIGTDVTFKIDPQYSAFLSNINENNITININAVLLKIDDAYIPINLEQTMDREVVNDTILETQILNSFKTRLAYKSGKIDLNSITGFSSNILSDANLMENYTPEGSPNAIYSAQVLLKGLYLNSLYYVVQENWKPELESTSSFYRTHIIKVQKNETNTWTIVEDQIIK